MAEDVAFEVALTTKREWGDSHWIAVKWAKDSILHKLKNQIVEREYVQFQNKYVSGVQCVCYKSKRHERGVHANVYWNETKVIVHELTQITTLKIETQMK